MDEWSESVPYHQDLHDIAKEANNMVVIERLTHHIQRIREAQDRTEKAVSQIADALTRLALVEERQSNTTASIDRLATSLDKLEIRLKALELTGPNNARVTALVDKAMWGIVGGAVIYLVQKVLS